MLAATLRTLAEAGYMKGEERIDRRKLALDSATLLLENPIDQVDIDVIERQALIVGEIRASLFAENGYSEDVEKDLDGLIAQLAAGDGKIQELLDEQIGDKYVLCSKRVTRQMVDTEGRVTMTLKRSGKFVSRNPDVIEAFYWQEAMARYERSTQTVKKRIMLGVRRQPELVSHAPALVEHAHDFLQLELPRTTEEP
jgi:hypothetical protein